MSIAHFFKNLFRNNKSSNNSDDVFDWEVYEKSIADDPLHPVFECRKLLEEFSEYNIIRLYDSIDAFLFHPTVTTPTFRLSAPGMNFQFLKILSLLSPQNLDTFCFFHKSTFILPSFSWLTTTYPHVSLYVKTSQKSRLIEMFFLSVYRLH